MTAQVVGIFLFTYLLIARRLRWLPLVRPAGALLGSVANLIVAERGRDHYTLGFLEYLRFGVPATLLVLAAGVPLVWWATT